MPARVVAEFLSISPVQIKCSVMSENFSESLNPSLCKQNWVCAHHFLERGSLAFEPLEKNI